MTEPSFMGVPLETLRIESVTWEDEAVEHMRARRREQGVRCPDPEEATEAALEPNRVVRVAAGGRSLKVVGYSAMAGTLVKVWLWPKDFAEGDWYGGSAVDANPSDKRAYTTTE
ncbi:MAG: hypothetical protein ACRDWE_10115 [Acidimicrobiales bacterium]